MQPQAIACTPQIAIVIMHLSRQGVNSDAIVILMAAQCILLWLRLQYYLRCAQGCAPACMSSSALAYSGSNLGAGCQNLKAAAFQGVPGQQVCVRGHPGRHRF